MTLLSICGDVAKRVGVDAPATIVGNTDKTAVRLLALAQEEGKSLHKTHKWSALIRTQTVTTADGTATYALPSDFYAYIPSTGWNDTQNRPIIGSLTGQQWQFVKNSAAVSSAFNQKFRVQWDTSNSARRLTIYPTPSAVETLYLEYLSTDWCQSSGGTGQSAWAADDDTGRLDEELITLGLKWRYLKVIGMVYDIELEEYMGRLRAAKANDAPPTILRMNAGSGEVFPNLSDGGYGA